MCFVNKPGLEAILLGPHPFQRELQQAEAQVLYLRQNLGQADWGFPNEPLLVPNIDSQLTFTSSSRYIIQRIGTRKTA